jgi:hypothetical protein
MHRKTTRQRALAAAAFHGRNRDDLPHRPPALLPDFVDESLASDAIGFCDRIPG